MTEKTESLMPQQDKTEVLAQPETDVSNADLDSEQESKPTRSSAFEGIYERLPDISERSVDRFIAVCAIAFIMVIVVGILKANKIF